MTSNNVYFNNIINTELSGLTKDCKNSNRVKDNLFMNYTYQVPIIFYSPPILKKIKDLIYDGHKEYDDLDEYDRDQLAILCMNELKDDAYCAIIDHPDFHLTLHHLKMFMSTAKPEYAYDLAVTMNKIAREYFADDLKIVYSEHFDLLAKLHLESAA